ncbi:hypothetical protein SBC1_46450 (plasmid) [Caballeronia sp. SBC1]|uniref:DUF4148 domain-containing protein n=1 Tax=unclassified Caballeronia TaxID=2646786 RepID=UPI0013E1C2E0|nr:MULTISPECIES: DUF4148 domain-containing protein [unclassified Caballeronia]QIE26082.1 hypothetical protein SBC2_41520 [Caballeronia sp. SBC2]QIN64605.1 hypothetical protein SBC1_46450 [Caballeronia sp. SBC1]
MFKALIPSVVIASALAAPTFSFAQDNTQVTRSAVKTDLQQMEQSGYNPAAERTTYPDQAQAAEQRVESQRGVAATSYGPSMSGTSVSGMRSPMTPADGAHSIYFGH